VLVEFDFAQRSVQSDPFDRIGKQDCSTDWTHTDFVDYSEVVSFVHTEQTYFREVPDCVAVDFVVVDLADIGCYWGSGVAQMVAHHRRKP